MGDLGRKLSYEAAQCVILTCLTIPKLRTRFAVPAQIGIPHNLYNPSVPPTTSLSWPAPSEPPFLIDGADNSTIGVGPSRVYFAPQAAPHNLAYPPRPVPGSVADLDKIMQYCDFDTKQVCLIGVASTTLALNFS